MPATNIRRVVIGLSLLAAAMSGGGAAGAPTVEVVVADVDVGELLRGSTAEAVFTLRNTGDETLRILGADPG